MSHPATTRRATIAAICAFPAAVAGPTNADEVQFDAWERRYLVLFERAEHAPAEAVEPVALDAERVERLILTTPPRSTAAAAVKMRRVLDPAVGIGTMGEDDLHLVALRQVLNYLAGPGDSASPLALAA